MTHALYFVPRHTQFRLFLVAVKNHVEWFFLHEHSPAPPLYDPYWNPPYWEELFAESDIFLKHYIPNCC